MNSPSTHNYGITIDLPDGTKHVMYEPHETQLLFHQSNIKNLIAIGNRGGGKSLMLRMDAHMRALSVPNSNLILVRKTFPQLHQSHLIDLPGEMKLLGGFYHHTNHVAYYPNGSRLFLSHVSSEGDALNLLSAEFLGAYFDELSTIPWDYFRKLCASVRVKSGKGLLGVVRAATNPYGPSAKLIMDYFKNHDVDPDDDPDYIPGIWGAIQVNRQDNTHIDQEQYVQQFSGLSATVKRAWLDGEFSLEHALFEFHPVKTIDNITRPYHVINEVNLQKVLQAATIYRAYDHGYFPDPAVCLWIARLPNRYIVLYEKTWYKKTAAEIAVDIKAETERMGIERVYTTYCDPTMDINTGADVRTIKDIFEANGIPLDCSINNRERYASAVHTALNEEAEPGVPRLQICTPLPGKGLGCKELIKTIPQMRYDENHPLAMANHKQDHWVVALAYFLISHAAMDQNPFPERKKLRPWMKPKETDRYVLGSGNVRNTTY